MNNPSGLADNVFQWNNVVITYDGIKKMYVNGILAHSSSVSAYIDNLDELLVGKFTIIGPCPGGYFDGKIDDVAIWNRALVQSEIDELFNLNDLNALWSTGDTTSSITVQPTTTTTYTVTVDDGISSCTDDVTIR